MEEELNEYLGSITTDENRQALLRSVALLDTLGVGQHRDDIHRFLNTGDDNEHSQNLLDCFTLLTLHCERTINEMGVGVGDDVPLTVLNEILESFINLPNYGDPELLLDVLDSVDEVGPEETMCGVFELISPFKWYDFVNHLDYINEDLIVKIREVAEVRLPAEEERVDVSENRDRLHRFTEQRQSLLGLHWIRQGGSFNTPLDILLGRYEDLLSEMTDPKKLAIELVGLVLVSDLSSESYLDSVKALLESFLDDPLHITQAYQSLTSLLKETTVEET